MNAQKLLLAVFLTLAVGKCACKKLPPPQKKKPKPCGCYYKIYKG